MNELLTRRPDHPLPPETHERLRAELLATIETKPRRTLAPLVAAAAVLVVVAGLVVAIRTSKPHTAPPAAQPNATRALTPAETETLRQQCLTEANRITSKGMPHPFTDFTVLKAFEFSTVRDPKVVNTWLIGRGVETFRKLPGLEQPKFWLCSRTAGGVISESSIRFATGARITGGPFLRFARNAGVYTKTVARVTVQPKGQEPIDAALWNGFWFAPTVGRTGWGPYDSGDPGRDDFVIRAYDAAGRLLSTEPEPTPRTAPVTCPQVFVTLPNGKTDTVPQTPTRPECVEYRWPS
ncbi:hypothetical protein ACXJJ3_12120 [Kribbella sp. WER1]